MQKTRRSQFSNAPTQKAIELREWDYNVFKLLLASAKGPKPAWLKNYLDAGRDIEEFRVQE